MDSWSYLLSNYAPILTFGVKLLRKFKIAIFINYFSVECIFFHLYMFISDVFPLLIVIYYERDVKINSIKCGIYIFLQDLVLMISVKKYY